MCLSTVITEQNGADQTLMKNVSAIKLDGDRIVLTDIMGREAEVRGTLQSLDFVNNIIRVHTKRA